MVNVKELDNDKEDSGLEEDIEDGRERSKTEETEYKRQIKGNRRQKRHHTTETVNCS